jgi:hypothetical protein
MDGRLKKATLGNRCRKEKTHRLGEYQQEKEMGLHPKEGRVTGVQGNIRMRVEIKRVNMAALQRTE